MFRRRIAGEHGGFAVDGDTGAVPVHHEIGDGCGQRITLRHIADVDAAGLHLVENEIAGHIVAHAADQLHPVTKPRQYHRLVESVPAGVQTDIFRPVYIFLVGLFFLPPGDAVDDCLPDTYDFRCHVFLLPEPFPDSTYYL